MATDNDRTPAEQVIENAAKNVNGSSDAIAQFGILCYAKGNTDTRALLQDDLVALRTQVVVLTNDREQLNADVNKMAGRLVTYERLYQLEEARADAYMKWIEQKTCDCSPNGPIHKAACGFSAVLRELEPIIVAEGDANAR